MPKTGQPAHMQKLKTKSFQYQSNNTVDCYTEVLDYNNELKYIKCEYFTKEGDTYHVVGMEMNIVEEEFFTTKLVDSSTLGIVITSGELGLRRKWSVSRLRRKLYRLPINESNHHVLIPLLHGSV
jgi:hypothetical protein